MSFFARVSDSSGESDESLTSEEEYTSSEEEVTEEESEEDEDESDEDEDESDEESEEEEKKVIKSAADKWQDEMVTCMERIKNGLKIDDWSAANNEFDKLARLSTRAPNSLPGSTPVPATFFKSVRLISDGLANQNKQKKLNAINARSLNTLKQKVKKAQRENEDQWNKYVEDPEAYEKATAPAPQVEEVPKVKKPKAQIEDQFGAEEDEFQTVGKGGKSLVFSAEHVFKTLETILEQRGRKNTDKTTQTKALEKLLAVADSTYAKIRILLALASSYFDYNLTHKYMPTESWTVAQQHISTLLNLLLSQKNYVVQEITADYVEFEDRIPSSPEDRIEVRGSIYNLIDRLDDEFTRSLKELDPQAPEYIDRLRDEKSLYATIVNAQAYFERFDQAESLQRTVLKRLEHVYGKPEPVIRALENVAPSIESSKVWQRSSPQESKQVVPTICEYLIRAEINPRIRCKAMLIRIFHLAFNDQFYAARDMLLMSHIATIILSADVETQILYNRTIAQLGLAAFRNGLVDETETILRDLYANSTLVRERLAQGTQRRQGDAQLTPEQERQEQAKQLPFHLHINTDLLECAYLISAMLTEIAQITFEASDPERKRETRSRTFRRMLDLFDRQSFMGPPENKREFITQAAKVLQQGDWKKAIELVNSIKTWSYLPNEDFVKKTLAHKIQVEGLRTYLFAHASFYTTISLEYLATTFELPLSLVKSIVSTMIWNEQLTGSLDQASGILVLTRSERTPLQQMAIALADKASQLLTENERTAQAKLGDTDQKLDSLRDREGGGGQRRGGNERRHGRGPRGRGARDFQAPLGRSLQQRA